MDNFRKTAVLNPENETHGAKCRIVGGKKMLRGRNSMGVGWWGGGQSRRAKKSMTGIASLLL